MKIVVLTVALLFSAAAQAQVICQPLSDGRIVCTPAGGGPSIYRP